MAIEKMLMLNIVGHREDLDKVSNNIVLSNSVHIVNAMEEIRDSNFTVPTNEKNIKAMRDVEYIRPYVEEIEYSSISNKMKKIDKAYETYKSDIKISPEELIFKNEQIKELTDEIEGLLSERYSKLEQLRNEKKSLENTIEHLRYMENLDLDIKELKNLQNFSFDIIRIPKDNVIKLKENYENIPSIILKIYPEEDNNIYMVFSPKSLENESLRIIKALNGEVLSLRSDISGTPASIIEKLNEEIKNLDKEIKIQENELEKIFIKNKKKIFILEKSYELAIKSHEVKNNIAVTNEFFYLCGWIPKSKLDNFHKIIEKLENKLIIIEKDSKEVSENLIPPTKLDNNSFTKPFESLVNMYGTPSYKELDPTPFLAISYMLMFGIMFGDLGQGLVFAFIGLFLKYKKKRPNLGGVLTRIGISSSIFGVLYGSIFGFEDIIEPIFLRPMENITKVLVYAVIFGLSLLFIGYIFSLINNFKNHNLKEGLFGSNGIVGLLFYASIIYLMVIKFKKLPNPFSKGVWIAIFLVLIALILLKEPLANLIEGKTPLYNESKGDYYVESSFGILEVLLSMLSNTLSFIRVGAFAINHAGLFLAFSAMAQMTGNRAGSALMYILGNLVIIGLEGLIVFIQGLRLEYYELFSKYYEGSGIEYSPIGID